MKLVLVYSRTKSLFYQDIGIHYSYARNGSKKVRCLFKLRYFYYCNFVERKSNLWWIILSQWAINQLISAKVLDAFKIHSSKNGVLSHNLLYWYTAWKASVFRVFVVRIQSKCWKIRTKKTMNTDTFHAVIPTSSNTLQRKKKTKS